MLRAKSPASLMVINPTAASMRKHIEILKTWTVNQLIFMALKLRFCDTADAYDSLSPPKPAPHRCSTNNIWYDPQM